MFVQRSLVRVGSVLAAAALAAVLVGVSPASAVAAPALKVYLQTPQTVSAGELLEDTLGIQYVGEQATTSPVTFTFTVGPGLVPPGVEAYGELNYSAGITFGLSPPSCQAVGLSTTCVFQPGIQPGAQAWFRLHPSVTAQASGVLTSSVVVSGGGASRAVTAEQTMTVGPRGPFGLADAAVGLVNGDGSPALQAGSDPAGFTTSLGLRTFASRFLGDPMTVPVALFKDVVTHLPAGLVGNPTTTPRCTSNQLAEYETNHIAGPTGIIPKCPPESQVGLVHVFVGGRSGFAGIYNMVPAPGVAASFGVQYLSVVVLLDAHVRSDGGVDVLVRNTSTTISTTAVEVTLWGVPADSSYDHYRGVCLDSPILQGPNGLSCPSSAPRRALLRLPTLCSGDLSFDFEVDSWANPGQFAQASASAPPLSGCDVVPFDPSLNVESTSTTPDAPSGLDVRFSLPQSSNPEGLAQADLKSMTVTLPEGLTLNPSAADGLGACTDAELGLGSTTPAACPDSSKIGALTVRTPLLEEELEGSLFVRTQNSSDPASGEMYRIAVEIRDDARGIDIKLPGSLRADPVSGRLTATFAGIPQQPIGEFQFHVKSGPRAPLVTPSGCGPQAVGAQIAGWNGALRAPVVGFSIDCAGPAGFSPSFSAGTINPQAGAFSPFTATFSRQDGEQQLGGLTVRTPPGLLGVLKSVVQCPEPQASQGTCGPESLIGHTTVAAGAGPSPFYVQGQVFLTGPYNGAPFGLSVVVPAKAGPFDLGTVVVRARIEVDPHTARITVISDPLPRIVGGIPLHLRTVNVIVDRPGFTFNPTSCEPFAVDGTLGSVQGAVANVSSRFQAADCAALAFRPSFRVSTQARTSKTQGASLDVKVASSSGQANIGKTVVSLPKQLPARLTTIQQACPEATFAQNPAACPVASGIGVGTASTPILSSLVVGPAYLVSHGGAAFPDVVVVLQGEGVTVDLVGGVSIKHGITTATFENVPDVPIATFELRMPQGPHSGLAANLPAKARGSMCGQKLTMPTTLTGQNGAVLEQNTKISVIGCRKAKKAKHMSRKKHRVRGSVKKGK